MSHDPKKRIPNDSRRLPGVSRRLPPYPARSQRRRGPGGKGSEASPPRTPGDSTSVSRIPSLRGYAPGIRSGIRRKGGEVASLKASNNRPAVDAPAPGVAARATAGGGLEPGGDAPAPLAGHLPPDSAGRPPLAIVSRPEALPACGHAGALVVLTVKGQGQLCIDCWRRWVRGDLAWPQNGTCPETCSSPRREPSA